MLRKSIGLRLASVLGLLVLLMIVVSSVGWFGLQKIRSSAAVFIDREFALTQTVSDIRASMAQSRRFEKDVILAIGDNVSVAQAKQRWDAEQLKLDYSLQLLEEASHGPIQSNVGAVRENLRAYRVRFMALFGQIKLQAIDSPMAANRLLRSTDEQFAAAQSALDTMTHAISKASQSARSDMDEQQSHTLLVGTALMAAAVGLAVVSALQLRNSIVTPLEHASYVASQVTSGNLAVRIETDRVDELGEMMNSINRMVAALQERSEYIEEEHKRSASLEQEIAASRAKSEFLALMSHELRTPMAGVIGMLGLALRQEMTEAQRQQIELARSNAASLLNIVNDLIDLSKIEAGKMQIEQIPFELKQIVEESMLLVREGAKQKDLVCKLHFGENLSPYVMGDPNRVRQILSNLLSNALKFTERGSIRVSVTRCESLPGKTSTEDQDALRWMRFEVSDTGIGIPDDVLPRMFQKFEQADSSATRKFGGTGLGLSICRELVQLMGGHIRVISRLGEGSRFSFDLPMIPTQAPQKMESYSLPSHSDSLHVLVAEDSHTNWVIISSLLEHMGHRHTLAENGQKALETLATAGPFDVVLMDGRMPVMDGHQATRHIRSGKWNDLQFGNPQIPIFGLTANTSAGDREKFMSAGLDQFLAKPIDEQALYRALQTVIDQRQSLDGPPGSPPTAAPRAEPTDAPSTSPMPSPVAPKAPKQTSNRADARREKLIGVFSAQAPQLIQEIKDAASRSDWPNVAIKIHSLKGSVAYFWPQSKIYELCAELESLADTVQVDRFNPAFAEMEYELAQALEARQLG